MDNRGLWARMERPDRTGQETLARMLVIKNEVIVQPRRPSVPDPEMLRILSEAKNNPGKACGECHNCHKWYIESYLRRGWSEDMHWPKDAETFCLDCDKKLRIRRA